MVQKLTLGELCRSLPSTRKYELIISDFFSPVNTTLRFDRVYAEAGMNPNIVFTNRNGDHLSLRYLSGAERITTPEHGEAFRVYLGDEHSIRYGIGVISCVIKCYDT